MVVRSKYKAKSVRDGLGMGYRTRRGLEVSCQTYSLRRWREGLTIYYKGEAGGRATLSENISAVWTRV